MITISELDKLIGLLKEGSITREEFELLKAEIMTGSTHKELIKNDVKAQELSVTNTDYHSHKTESKNTRFRFSGGVIFACVWVVFIGSCLIYSIYSKNTSPQISNSLTSPVSNENTANNVEYNECNICGKKFTGRGYEEVSDGVWRLCKYPYQSYICSSWCGKKSTEKMDNALRNHGINPSIIHDDKSSNGSSYQGSNGRIYENNVCSMCKGTGIEKNNSSFSDEYGRICPICNGKGVRSY
jgi:hypothetical protein